MSLEKLEKRLFAGQQVAEDLADALMVPGAPELLLAYAAIAVPRSRESALSVVKAIAMATVLGDVRARLADHDRTHG